MARDRRNRQDDARKEVHAAPKQIEADKATTGTMLGAALLSSRSLHTNVSEAFERLSGHSINTDLLKELLSDQVIKREIGESEQGRFAAAWIRNLEVGRHATSVNEHHDGVDRDRVHRHCIGSGFAPYCHRDDLISHEIATSHQIETLVAQDELVCHTKSRLLVKPTDKLIASLHPVTRMSNWIWWPPLSNYVRYVGALLLTSFFVAQLQPGGFLTLIFKPADFFREFLQGNAEGWSTGW